MTLFRSIIATALFMINALVAGATSEASAQDLQSALRFNKEGNELLAAGKYHRAVPTFEAMIAACGDHDECLAAGYTSLARCLLETAQYDRATDTVEKAVSRAERLKSRKPVGTALNVQGRIFAARDDFRRAIETFGRAEEAIHPSTPGGKAELGFIAVNKAGAHVALYEHQDADRELKKAEGLFAGSSETNKALVYRERAKLAAQTQNWNEAVGLYDQAMRIWKKSGNQREIAAILLDMGLMDEYRSSYGAAAKQYREARRLAGDIKDRSLEASAVDRMANVERLTGNYHRALELYEKALADRRELGQKRLEAITLNSLGLVYFYLPEYSYEDAETCFREAYRLAKADGYRDAQAWAAHDLGLYMMHRARFVESRIGFDEAIRLGREIGNHKIESNARLRLGNLYDFLGDFDGSKGQYEEAARIQERIGDRLFLGRTLSFQAAGAARGADVASAEGFFEKALNLNKKLDVPHAELLSTYALFLISKKNYDPRSPVTDKDLSKASGLILEAERESQKEGRVNKNDLMLTMYARGRQLLAAGKGDHIRAAVDKFNEMRKLADAQGTLKFGFIANVGLGLAQEAAKEWLKAEQSFRRAVDYAEEIRESLDDEQSRLTFLDGEEVLGLKHVVPYEGLARVLHMKGNSAAAWEAAERTKARAFADSLAKSMRDALRQGDEQTAALVDKLEKAEKGLKQTYQQMTESSAKGGDPSEIDRSRKERVKAKAMLAEAKKIIKERHPEYSDAMFAEFKPIEDSALRDDEYALVYEVTDGGTLIFLSKGKTLLKTVFKPDTKQRMEELVGRYREAFELGGLDEKDAVERMKSFDPKLGKELADILLGDLLSLLPEKVPVGIVPDDALRDLPFEALVLNSGGRVVMGAYYPRTQGVAFFNDRNPIYYHQSITAQKLARSREQRAKAVTPKFLIMADPDVSCGSGGPGDESGPDVGQEIEQMLEKARRKPPEASRAKGLNMLSADECELVKSRFERLEKTRELAQALESRFKGDTEVYIGDRAGAGYFRDRIAARLSGFGKLLFATHASMGDKNDPNERFRQPSILLSSVPSGTDPFLRMSEVIKCRLNADIVALMACQTGLGKRVAGEGVLGLGRAFQEAGARSVLMSLWSAPEQATMALADRFFTGIKEGKTKLESMQEARKQVRLSEDGEYDHPFFWSCFVLVGEDR
ncbi:MAG: CHAT domain-containing tetratricopeptide repeat protein [Pseudomonadota bacterium]